MRSRDECRRLQKLADEIKAEFPDANYDQILWKALMRGESRDDAEFIAVCACSG